jgi:hypothetical protein
MSLQMLIHAKQIEAYPSHPRLLLSDSLAQDIWARIDSSDPALQSLDDMWEKLEGRAQYAISSSAWWGSFYRYREIQKLALAGLLLRQSDIRSLKELGEEYADSAISICERVIVNDNTPDHSWTQLKACHRVRALAVTYDYGFDRLATEQSVLFEDAILRNLYGEEGEHSIHDHFINPANIHSGNHGADWGTAMLFGAIALEGEIDITNDQDFPYTADSAQAHIELVKDWMFTNNDCYFKRMYGRDGACVEGLHYGFVNLGFTIQALQALSVVDGKEWFKDSGYDYVEDRLSQFDDWITYEMLPRPARRSSDCDDPAVVGMNMLNDTHNHGDGYDPGEQIFRMLALAGIYDQDLAVWDFQQTRVSIDSLNDLNSCGFDRYELLTAADWIVALLNYKEMIVAGPETQLPNSAYFRDRGLICWRDGWGEDGIQFTFESAPAVYRNTLVEEDTIYSDKHDQSDKNSFTLYAYGEPFIIDYGWTPTNTPIGRATNENNYILIDSVGEALGKGCLTNGMIVKHDTTSFANFLHGNAKDAFDALWWGHDDNDEPVRLTIGDAIPGFQDSSGYLNPVHHADRYVQFIKENEGVPAYFVMLDDIQKDSLTHSYEWLAQTSHSNSIDHSLDSIHIHNVNSLYIYVVNPESCSITTEEIAYIHDVTAAVKLKRIRIRKSGVDNPFFHMVLFPHKTDSTMCSWDTIPVTGGSIAKMSWTDYVDYSIFTHGDRITSGSMNTDAVISLVREKTAQDSVTRFIMCEGSQLTFEEKVLADLHGQDGVVVNSGTVVDIVSENATFFKIYAPEAQTVRLNEVSISYSRIGNYVFRDNALLNGIDDP